MFIAQDINSFKNRFRENLARMLATDELGSFILVLANSMQDEELFGQLRKPLQAHFARLMQFDPEGPPDDQQVFAALRNGNLQNMSPWQTHLQGDWELVINPLRSLRPSRFSSEAFSTLHQRFDTNRFNFNKPFLKPEILWEDHDAGMKLRVLYNKFPFAPWHLLVVPEPDKQLPQFLTLEHHQHIMRLVTAQAASLPGLGMAFNSLGAYASINQLHFQGFVRETPFPLEHERWRHNGGSKDYPLRCLKTASADDSWEIIAALHCENQPYNLLYRPDCCYIIPRLGQGLIELPTWAQGMAWHEVCGVFTLPDLQVIRETDEITQILGKLR